MNGLLKFWADHGTKVLGTLIAINSGLAAGSVVLPPPLNVHSTVIAQWAVFINFILGVVVVQRGNANTSAIAAQVTSNQMAAASGFPPPLPPAQPEVVKAMEKKS